MNDWQDLVELERLALWMDSKGLESGSIEAPLRLTGGTQNLLLRCNAVANRRNAEAWCFSPETIEALPAHARA